MFSAKPASAFVSEKAASRRFKLRTCPLARERERYGVSLAIEDQMRQGIGSLALCLLAATAGVLPASADSISWTITNRTRDPLQVSFYSQDRHHEWPGDGRSWDLFDNRPHTFSLGCIRGETICYGAFVYQTHSRYWGVGFKNSKSCKGCCGTCGAGSMENSLGN
ncbi:MAG: hypothetical protein ACLPGW_07550 [Roseiarcus sp.]